MTDKEMSNPDLYATGESVPLTHNEREFARRDYRAERIDDDLEDLLLSLDDDTDTDEGTSSKQSEAATKGLAAKATKPSAPSLSAPKFPFTSIEQVVPIEEPNAKLEMLADELAKHGKYESVREEYCRLSILINLEGLLAPAFRPALVTGKKRGDPVFHQIHRDKLMIDCHWLHSTKQTISIRAKDIEYKAIFYKNKPFPFDLAWQFANKNWKADHRVIDMLRLTVFQQCQLSALRSEAVKQKIQQAEQGSRKDGVFTPAPQSVFVQALNSWCERDCRISKHRDGYVAAWRARTYLDASASVSQVGALTALILGEPPKDDKTIRSRLANIIRHCGGTMSVSAAPLRRAVSGGITNSENKKLV